LQQFATTQSTATGFRMADVTMRSGSFDRDDVRDFARGKLKTVQGSFYPRGCVVTNLVADQPLLEGRGAK
jgi:hypothetical protein